MNCKLVGFLVRGKLIPGENFYKILDSQPIIIAQLTYILNQISSSPLVPDKNSQPGHVSPLVKARHHRDFELEGLASLV